jgi:hypothetical protein
MASPYLNRPLRTVSEVTRHMPDDTKPFLMDASEVCISSRDAKPKKYSLFLELCIIAIAVGALWAML